MAIMLGAAQAPGGVPKWPVLAHPKYGKRVVNSKS
jgi:hypothetical protein